MMTTITRVLVLAVLPLALCAILQSADDAPARIAVPTEQSWPVYRGDAQARGIAAAKLPDKLDMLWKMTVPSGAFEATPVIEGGVVYVPDMDGKVFALNLTT